MITCNPIERQLWKEAIKKEFGDMKKRNVWKIISADKVPPNRRLIGCKQVFKVKRDNTHRARLVALGYSQIPSVDFTGNYAPVIDEASKLVLEASHLMDLSGEIIDIGNAFLYGDLEEDIYMTVPEGLEYFEEISDNCCCNLFGIIYGLVQASSSRNLSSSLKKN